jgi:nucleoside-diphosphate-sugar epimerase
LAKQFPHQKDVKSICSDFRAADVRHLLVDIGKAERLLDYRHTPRISEELKEEMVWYVADWQSRMAEQI